MLKDLCHYFAQSGRLDVFEVFDCGLHFFSGDLTNVHIEVLQGMFNVKVMDDDRVWLTKGFPEVFNPPLILLVLGGKRFTFLSLIRTLVLLFVKFNSLTMRCKVLK